MKTKCEIHCPHCSYATNLSSDLENHMKNEGEKKIKCDYCEFIGKSLSELRHTLQK